ncbi:MAG: hypothetical protein AAFQ77_01475 [Myxococcota bacterium]
MHIAILFIIQISSAAADSQPSCPIPCRFGSEAKCQTVRVAIENGATAGELREKHGIIVSSSFVDSYRTPESRAPLLAVELSDSGWLLACGSREDDPWTGVADGATFGFEATLYRISSSGESENLGEATGAVDGSPLGITPMMPEVFYATPRGVRWQTVVAGSNDDERIAYPLFESTLEYAEGRAVRKDVCLFSDDEAIRDVAKPAMGKKVTKVAPTDVSLLVAESEVSVQVRAEHPSRRRRITLSTALRASLLRSDAEGERTP